MSDTEALKDRTVLVTEAASGIGRQLARDLFWWGNESKSTIKSYDEDYPRFSFETPFQGRCPSHAKMCPTERVPSPSPEGSRSFCVGGLEAPEGTHDPLLTCAPCPTAISSEHLMEFSRRLLAELRDQKMLFV